jgi:PKD repeat protein
MSYAWDFGDGTTSTLVSPSHIYATTGTFNVKLVVTSNLGCKDSITQITIITLTGGGGGMPTPSFTVNTAQQCFTGNSFVFTNTSFATIGTTYNWNFGDNTFSNLASPTHTYSTSGYFNVQMIATYNGQNYYANSQSIYVGAKPVVSFNTITGTGSGNAHTFISTSTIANGSMSYAWDFGDGGTSTQNSPQHIYSTAGTVNVKLVVTSDLGCKDSITQAVVICPTLNNQAFSINAASSCFTGNYFGVQNFFGNNAGYPMTYLWNYGDGFTSTAQNPAWHSYAAVGTYNII